MTEEKTNCQLCKAVSDSKTNKPSIENRQLFSTKSFIVTPCIGPINPGHVLIISKKHIENLSCMKVDKVQELLTIKKLLWNDLNKFYFNCLIAEHGAFDFQQKSGACIIHTHLHVIPDAKECINAFDEMLEFKTLSCLNDIVQLNFPYILVMTKQIIKAYHAESVPSQMIRQLVLSSKGENLNWDWRTQPKNDFNKRTIEIWNNEKK